MIVRAKPIVNEDLILAILNGNQYDVNGLSRNMFFYNSGSNALLEFLLLFGENKRVGIQVFTCATVKNAILKAKDIPIYFDIEEDFFSTSYQQIFEKINQIDILILTHLFGIPNPDVSLIRDLCKEKGVVLINDLCQTYHSKVNGMYVEDVCDNYFYSFFYDKPISCMFGGMLSVGAQYVEQIQNRYGQLPKRGDRIGKKHLHQLLLLSRLTSPLYYLRDFRTGSLWKRLFELYPTEWSMTLLNRIVNNRFFHFLDRVLRSDSNNSGQIERLSDIEIFYILKMMSLFRNNNQTLMDFFLRKNLSLPAYLLNTNCECAFSKRGLVRKEYVSNNHGIEIGLYNWPDLISSDSNMFPNAQTVINSYVNIPLHSDSILL